MRHRKDKRKLNRTASHRKAMFSNMTISLLEHERISTTLPKAKELRRVAEKMITLGKKGDLNSRRIALKTVKDKKVLKKLFSVLSERYTNREGGYTRIYKNGFRRGDCAPMAIIELVDANTNTTEETKKVKKSWKDRLFGKADTVEEKEK